MTDEKLVIRNQASSDCMWRGIGHHFDSLSEILCEFIDNAISNFNGNMSEVVQRSILITLQELEDSSVRVTIQDTGTGIKNLEAAFTLGSSEGKETALNEHGFGFKHALAAANPANDAWRICTRTKEDAAKGVFKQVKAPYCIMNQPFTYEPAIDWPGEFPGSTGSYFEFVCSRNMYHTIHRGLKGGFTCFAGATIEVLLEELGYIYAGALSTISFMVIATDRLGLETHYNVSPVEPDFAEFYIDDQDPDCKRRLNSRESVDLGGGELEIRYKFGKINPSSSNRKYYKGNITSSGVEIRANGRLLASNLFKEIWGIEPHNAYNYYLVQIDLITTAPSTKALPATKTTKNGFDQGDEKLTNLYSWIIRKKEKPVKCSRAQIIGDPNLTEIELFKELEDTFKRNPFAPTQKIGRELNAFESLGEKIRMDLVVEGSGQFLIFEGKKDKTTPQDVYQLVMYWDGAVYDGHHPTKGYLVGSSHPESVEKIIQSVNKMRDARGNTYNIETCSWQRWGIEYPPGSTKL